MPPPSSPRSETRWTAERAARLNWSAAVNSALTGASIRAGVAPSSEIFLARGAIQVSWLKKLMPARIRTEAPAGRKRSVPEGLWEKCDRCGAVLYRPELEENLEVCPKCNHHMAIRARVRLKAFLDPGTPGEIGASLGPTDVLKFKDQKKYSERIKAAQKSSGERDALVAPDVCETNAALVHVEERAAVLPVVPGGHRVR